ACSGVDASSTFRPNPLGVWLAWNPSPDRLFSVARPAQAPPNCMRERLTAYCNTGGRMQESGRTPMKRLSFGLALAGFFAMVHLVVQLNSSGALLAAALLISAFTTFRSNEISSFLKIFVGIFTTEAMISGLLVTAGQGGLWPAQYQNYLPPDTLPFTLAIFS